MPVHRLATVAPQRAIPLWGDGTLNQLGHNLSLGNEIGHANEGDVDKQTSQGIGHWSQTIHNHHGPFEQGHLQRSSARGHDSEVGGMRNVIGIPLDDLNGGRVGAGRSFDSVEVKR